MTTRDFKRVAIVDRGEAAIRFIIAAREYGQERGEALETIALYTEPDRRAVFVREADVAHPIGQATYLAPNGARKASYLDLERIEQALVETGADAVWPGRQFVAELPEFVDLCEGLGLVFIGPTAEAMQVLGDEIECRQLAERVGLPVAPWSGGAVPSLEAAREHTARLGYPLLIKVTAGGGGRTRWRAGNDDELADAFQSARTEAKRALGSGEVFLERMTTGARQIEVPVVADDHGTTWSLGVRDCTIQRRYHKVLEETPCPVLSADQQGEIERAAVRLAKAASFKSAGAVQFLYDASKQEFSFAGAVARLQVEHPISEVTTGLDLVKLQIRIALGERLEPEPPEGRGHAIEARLRAVNPEDDFAPSPGVVERLRLAGGPGLRVDTGVAEGDEIPAALSLAIAKTVAYGRTRQEAIARLRRALLESEVVIRGGTSNKGFLLSLLDHPDFRSNEVDIGWMDRLVAEGKHLARRGAEVAVLQAAIETYDAEFDIERAQFFTTAARGRPHVEATYGQSVALTYRGKTYQLDVFRLGPRAYRIDVEGRRIELLMERFEGAERRLSIDGERFRIEFADQGPSVSVGVDGISHRVWRDRGAVVRAPSPAIVVDVLVNEGQDVDVGDGLVVLEAMKMEMVVASPYAGKVRDISIINGVQVPIGTPMLLIEPGGSEGAHPQAEELDFSELVSAQPPTSSTNQLAELQRLILGYDADRAAISRGMKDGQLLDEDTEPDDRARIALEDDILNTFVDMCALFRRQSAEGDAAEDFGKHTAEEHMFTFLRDLVVRREGELPQPFLDKLRRAVSHYGLNGIGRGPALEEVLFRICKGNRRADERIGPILSLLQSRLDHVSTLRETAGDDFRELLARMIMETRNRYPEIYGIARELQYHYFERPITEKIADAALAEADSVLSALAADPEGADRASQIAELIAVPLPLKGFFSRRLEVASGAERLIMLEALARRYYKMCELHDFRLESQGGIDVSGCWYEHEGKKIHFFATHIVDEELSAAIQALRQKVDSVPSNQDVVLDFYVWKRGELEHPDETSRRIAAALDDARFPRPVRRVIVALTGSETGLGAGGFQGYTFRMRDDGFHEELIYRGMHPMLSKRLFLWRLKDLETERIASAEDVYLYRVTGKDERLICLAEVRDLTPVRNTAGEVVALPSLERTLSKCLIAIGHEQSRRPAHKQYQGNRVHLFLWPPLELTQHEIAALSRKLAPETTGLGLERIVVQGSIRNPATGEFEQKLLDVSAHGGRGVRVQLRDVPDHPMRRRTTYEQNVVRLRQRGLTHPYEIINMLTPGEDSDVQSDFPRGKFQEYDLNGDNELVPVDRPPGENASNIVVGLLTSYTDKYPDGMTRVALFGDPSRGMGNLAEPECRRINAGLDLAEQMGIPAEWYAVSAGARISMESGTENMDWISAVLKRLIEFTQAGCEINILVCGINVGAQPYWNAEATMLMHTRGILVMIPGSAMVLTGKQALDYSGSVSAEDNTGIGGYDRVMGPNGQAQYFAHDLADACQILLRHYDHTYIAPGERFPRRGATNDPVDRDVRESPHGKVGAATFETIGEVFDPKTNPGRKRPFAIRKVMHAAVDQDRDVLERWYGMQDAETAVVWDAHIGGYPVCLLGLESQPLPRLGFVPADGPTGWTSGTLFPMSSKKVARAINAASGNRTVVVLANLSGFDGSPESLRNLQLEYGAEIGRAVVNFKGPMVFLVVSRYHGGAFVVFSSKLNPSLEVSALEDTYASVIGGAPAAAVVFARDVRKRTHSDARIIDLNQALEQARGAERVVLRERLNKMEKVVYSEKLREVAEEFDTIHSVHRALEMGSVHRIIPALELRPYLVDAIERGMKREQAAE